jgi:hypothetical protein
MCVGINLKIAKVGSMYSINGCHWANLQDKHLVSPLKFVIDLKFVDPHMRDHFQTRRKVSHKSNVDN